MSDIKIYKSNYDKLCVVISKGETDSLIAYLEQDTSKTKRLSKPIKVNNENIIDISELDNFIKNINDNADSLILDFKNKLKSTKAIDYPQDYEIKKRIKKVAENIANSDIEHEDVTFENSLKEIYQLKVQLYCDKNSGASDARKHNGNIKYEIKNVEIDRNSRLEYLDMDTILRLL